MIRVQKRDSGVSMVGLVITIIVVIVLTAIVFVGGRSTINRAGLARYEAIIGDLEAILDVRYTHLNGVLTMEQDNYKPKQIYYMVATGTRLSDTNLLKVTGKISDLGTIGPETLEGENFYQITDEEILTSLEEGRNYDAKQTYYVTDAGEIFTLPGHYMGDAEEDTWYINREKYYISPSPIEPIIADFVNENL